ncbi:hypothetical protein WJX74_004415 [Apatococcus lobatus]|uniref:Reverse transcriptase domain-containing protein n=1 Tax=Apatococcus lobatus TaxID=904363 RepID=A0AAW1Q5Z5_9CHLO
MVSTSLSFKVADGRIARSMGELNGVKLSFGDCDFTVCLAVVDSMEHTLMLGVSFVHQAGGTNAMVEPYWTVKDDCTTTEWGGLNVWCNPSFHMVGAVLENYLRCKKGSPTNTSATFVVPGWVGAAWWEMLKSICRLVRYYPPWSHIFTASPVKGADARRLLGPVRWPVAVAVSDAGPLPSQNMARREGDWDPEYLEKVIEEQARLKPDPEVDPLDMIKLAPDLTELQKEQVNDRLRLFNKTLWAITNYDLMEPINVIEHRIHVSDPAPIVRKGPPKSHAELWFSSHKSLGTPNLQKSGYASITAVIRPRGRNDKTYGDDTACPEVLPTLQALGASKWFGSADGKSAFHQIAMAADSRRYTAFQIKGEGAYEFLRMPFGLKTAPATFIRAINMILEGSSRLHSFVDDIKHGAPDWEGHLDDITDLANRATLHKLRLSPKKFYAGFRSLKGFGYIVDFQGFHPDPEKVEPILSILTPTDVTGIRSFVGMVNYYSALVPNISRWTGPHNDLTQKGRNAIRDWTEVHTQCFETLKQALADAPGLAFPDVEKRIYPGPCLVYPKTQWQLDFGSLYWWRPIRKLTRARPLPPELGRRAAMAWVF